MDDVLYFQKKFFQTLNVPVNRLNSDALFSLGRATEVSRDELKFARFISRLRGKFSVLFTRLLEKQVVLKQIMSIEDWNNIQQDIKYDFSKDNYFSELKDAEIIQNRINLAQAAQPYVGMYYSNEWLRKNILQQTDEDIEDMDAEINVEMQNPRWNQALAQQQQMDQQAAAQGVQPLAGDEDVAATPETDARAQKLRQAQTDYNLLKPKKGNRSMQDEARFKSAVQILARNK
jgi:hypothetical protein